MRNEANKNMTEHERLKRCYALRDMCKLHLLGQDDQEYRTQIEHWIIIVTEEINKSLARIELGAV